jgi:hypothetical protein
MKALDTEYKGFRFRSRLEARWAVFMDAMGVPYEYEREAYDLDGLFYLPDFWLPQMKAHLEIKPDAATPEEWDKATRLANHSKLPVYVMCGQPECPDIGDNWYQNESQATLVLPSDGKDERGDIHYIWCECPHCHRCELQFDGRADRIDCGCPKSEHGDKGYNCDSERLRAAYAKARGYRFEPSARNAV